MNKTHSPKKASRWTAATSPTPVWVDDIQTQESFAIIATKTNAKEYNCICYDVDHDRLRMYPSVYYWIKPEVLEAMGFKSTWRGYDLVLGTYTPFTAPIWSVRRLLGHLAATGQVTVVTEGNIADARTCPDVPYPRNKRGGPMYPHYNTRGERMRTPVLSLVA